MLVTWFWLELGLQALTGPNGFCLSTSMSVTLMLHRADGASVTICLPYTDALDRGLV